MKRNPRRKGGGILLRRLGLTAIHPVQGSMSDGHTPTACGRAAVDRETARDSLGQAQAELTCRKPRWEQGKSDGTFPDPKGG